MEWDSGSCGCVSLECVLWKTSSTGLRGHSFRTHPVGVDTRPHMTVFACVLRGLSMCMSL